MIALGIAIVVMVLVFHGCLWSFYRARQASNRLIAALEKNVAAQKALVDAERWLVKALQSEIKAKDALIAAYRPPFMKLPPSAELDMITPEVMVQVSPADFDTATMRYKANELRIHRDLGGKVTLVGGKPGNTGGEATFGKDPEFAPTQTHEMMSNRFSNSSAVQLTPEALEETLKALKAPFNMRPNPVVESPYFAPTRTHEKDEAGHVLASDAQPWPNVCVNPTQICVDPAQPGADHSSITVSGVSEAAKKLRAAIKANPGPRDLTDEELDLLRSDLRCNVVRARVLDKYLDVWPPKEAE